MGLNYQQILTGLCIVLVILLVVDIKLRYVEDGLVDVVYVTNSVDDDKNRTANSGTFQVPHRPPNAQKFEYKDLTEEEILHADKDAKLTRDEEDYVLKVC